MDELRKMLESTAHEPSAEPVAKPSPTASATAERPSKTRAKITRVGEGDEHFALDIQDADIRDVLEMISRQGQINILPSNSVKGKVTASLHDVDLDSALAAILKSTGYVTRRHGKFIYVGTSHDFESLEQSLDKIGTRIYRTNYVRAADLQALITPLLTQGVGAISVTTPSETGIAADSTKAGGNSFAGGDAVLVRDYEAVLAQIDQVVAEIDKRPLQVAIEAMILSVALDDSDQFGVNFQLLRQNSHIALASGSPPTSTSDVNFSSGGLTFGFLDTTLGAFLSAVETVGDTHVIATPRVVCLDKQRAEILIGSQLGYISSTVTETSTAQNVNFLEVGTQLRIRPFISSDGLVRMEVHPELSTGQVITQGGFTLPNKDLTQVTTNVMVRDGATVVIGGLIREDLTTNTTQIPLLGNLPGVGFLFRQKQETTQRNEILVLITPHIVYDCEAGAEGARGATEFHRREAVYADQMSPIGKRHLGRKYYRLAQEAFAGGDQPRALRFIDLSIHFDPLNRAAIDLRTDIVTGNHFGAHTEVKFPTVTAPAATMVAQPEGQNLPGWMLNELDHPPPEGTAAAPPDGAVPPPPAPMHPLDPGQPGSSTTIQRPYQFE
jgi:type IV pilus assembly protein PilQ